ncbi:MAG: DUF3243 family protein [Candidatus Desulforudis sp.]|nr:DUF3243 family protein [Desulforudis sp.]
MELETERQDWKGLIGKGIQAAENIGLSDKTIENLTYRVGGVIADFFDPADREQRLLKELWEQGDESEKRTLASLFARMADHDTGRKGPEEAKAKK